MSEKEKTVDKTVAFDFVKHTNQVLEQQEKKYNESIQQYKTTALQDAYYHGLRDGFETLMKVLRINQDISGVQLIREFYVKNKTEEKGCP